MSFASNLLVLFTLFLAFVNPSSSFAHGDNHNQWAISQRTYFAAATTQLGPLDIVNVQDIKLLHLAYKYASIRALIQSGQATTQNYMIQAKLLNAIHRRTIELATIDIENHNELDTITKLTGLTIEKEDVVTLNKPTEAKQAANTTHVSQKSHGMKSPSEKQRSRSDEIRSWEMVKQVFFASLCAQAIGYARGFSSRLKSYIVG